MGLRPPKTIEQGKTPRNIIDSATAPRATPQQTHQRQQPTADQAEAFDGLQRIV